MALLTLHRSGIANATPAIPFPPPMASPFGMSVQYRWYHLLGAVHDLSTVSTYLYELNCNDCNLV